MALEGLKMSMAITMALLFGTLAAILGIILFLVGPSLGLGLGIVTVVFFALVIVGLQWYFSPAIIKWTTRMSELDPKDYAWIHAMVEELSEKAGVKKPRLYLVYDGTPNAFAFGRTKNNSYIAIHAGLLNTLNKDEIKAVLAHEMGHIKHWDVVVITLASMVPLLVYFGVVFLGSMVLRNEEGRDNLFNGILIWIGAMLAQFLSSLIVMRLSRTREYYADAFSAVATGSPKDLRTALAKICYGFPTGIPVKDYEGRRAFFIADPNESSQASSAALGREVEESEEKRRAEPAEYHSVNPKEIDRAIEWEKHQGKLFEIFTTHPLAYKRINALNEVEKDIKAGRLNMSNV